MNQTSLLARQSADLTAESRASRRETVHQPAPDSNGFIFWLDEPQVWRTKSRGLRLSGWCLHVSGKPVTSIRARIGGRQFVTAAEILRPDVANYFGRSQENLPCGFSFDVRMPRGRGLLTIEGQTNGSPWTKILVTTVRGPFLATGERRRRKERDLAATIQRYRWWYDRPANWQKPTSILYVSGWFIDTIGLPIRGIRARIGRQFFRANVGLRRDDVFAAYPELPSSRYSGFAIAIPLPRRASKILLQYQGADGIWRDFDSHRIQHGDRPAEVPPPSQMSFFTAPSALNPRFSSWVPALSLLFNTMERYQYAAAYSILCRFRKSPKHPVGLLSHYDWDPEILVQGPYVDAMAMFRRDTLLDLGGYDHTLSEIGWFGWKDYDMWLRFAQKDLPVGFVPNILCLYRHHETSMINTTNLFARELVGLFQKRYHSLADRFAPREKLFGIDREKLTAPTEMSDAIS